MSATQLVYRFARLVVVGIVALTFVTYLREIHLAWPDAFFWAVVVLVVGAGLLAVYGEQLGRGKPKCSHGEQLCAGRVADNGGRHVDIVLDHEEMGYPILNESVTVYKAKGARQ